MRMFNKVNVTDLSMNLYEYDLTVICMCPSLMLSNYTNWNSYVISDMHF